MRAATILVLLAAPMIAAAAPATPDAHRSGAAADPALEELAVELEMSGRAAIDAAAFLETLSGLFRAGAGEYFRAQALLGQPRAPDDMRPIHAARVQLAALLGKLDAAGAQLAALVPVRLDRTAEAALVGLPLATRLAYARTLNAAVARATEASDRRLAAILAGDFHAEAAANGELTTAQLELVEAREALALDEAAFRSDESAERFGRLALAMVFRANHLLLRLGDAAEGGVIAAQPWVSEELQALALEARVIGGGGRAALAREAAERAADRTDAGADEPPEFMRLRDIADAFAREDAAAVAEAESIASWADGLLRAAQDGGIGTQALDLSGQQVFAAEGRLLAIDARMIALLGDLGRSRLAAAEALARPPTP
jgi:hypothetical protein